MFPGRNAEKNGVDTAETNIDTKKLYNGPESKELLQQRGGSNEEAGNWLKQRVLNLGSRGKQGENEKQHKQK